MHDKEENRGLDSQPNQNKPGPERGERKAPGRPYIDPRSYGMTGFRAYLHGFRRGRKRWKTVLSIYLFELAWVFLFSLPVYFIFLRLTARRPAGIGMTTGWDSELLGEIFMDHPTLFPALLGLTIAASICVLVVSPFFTGGLIGTEIKKNRNFFSESVKHGPCLLLIQLLHYIPGLLLFFFFVFSLRSGASWGEEFSHRGRMITMVATSLPALALLTAWDAALDFSRVWFVDRRPTGRRGVLKGFASGWAILWRRGPAAVLLHVGYAAPTMITAAGIVPVVLLLDASIPLPPIGLFFITQVFAFARTYLRVSSLLGRHAFALKRPPHEQPCGESKGSLEP